MMNPERHARLDAIKHEQMGREHGYHDLSAGKPPISDENTKDQAAQSKAYNSKEGYC